MHRKFFLSYYHYKIWHRRLLCFIFDFLGTIIFTPLHIFQTLIREGGIRRILIIRNDALGDVIMTLPAIAMIQKKYPQAELTLFSTEEASLLLNGNPMFNKIIPFKHHWFSKSRWPQMLGEALGHLSNIKKKEYDLGIDFRGDLRNILLLYLAKIPIRLGYGVTGGGFLLTHSKTYPENTHQVLVNLKLLESIDITTRSAQTQLQISLIQQEKAFKLLPPDFLKIKKPLLFIHPSAGYHTKKWASSSFSQLIHNILENNLAKIVLIGTEGEKPDLSIAQGTELLDLRGLTPLNYLPALFSLGDFYLGNDSGPAHLAAAIGLPMIILFSGTNNPEVWKPWSTQLHLIQKQVPCAPCESKDCPYTHHDCMRKITVEEVFKTLKENLKSLQRTP